MQYYVCTIKPNTALLTPKFSDKDLVSWILPDGQYIKKVLKVDANDKVLDGTDTLHWRPYQNMLSGPDVINAYVAKKGGQTNPGRAISASTTFTYGLSTKPERFAFAPGANCQINRSWEFASGFDNFLILSYQAPKPTASGVPCLIKINLDLNPLKKTQLPVTLKEYISFNQENITSTDTTVSIVTTSIPSSGVTNHVFLKFTTNAPVGDVIQINVRGDSNTCGSNPDAWSSALTFESKGTPHDPNYKSVHVKTINSNSAATTTLNYTIQFQNDGTAPVDIVRVKDVLPPELQWDSYQNLDAKKKKFPTIGVISRFRPEERNLDFYNLKLPGLSQRNPSYGYEETLHWFSFSVKANAYTKSIVDNKAEITFVGAPDPPMETNIARVTPYPVCPKAINLLKNGSFDIGRKDTYKIPGLPPGCNKCKDGGYCLGSQFKNKCSTWANSFDHTTGNANGRFLMIDGDPTKPAIVWTDSVCVMPGQIYTFSFWLKSLNKRPFQIGMLIDGVLVSNVTARQESAQWTEYRCSWVAPGRKCIPIAIQQITGGKLIDFGLDDIFFGYCPTQ